MTSRRYTQRFGPESFKELKRDVVKLHDLLEAREAGDVTYDDISSDIHEVLSYISFECVIIQKKMDELYINDTDLDWNTGNRDGGLNDE